MGTALGVAAGAAGAIGDAAIGFTLTALAPAAALAIGATILTTPTSYDDGGELARRVDSASGRSLEDVLSDPGICKSFLNHKFPNDKPYSPDDAQKIWNEMLKRGLNPRRDPGHPGTQWPAPHINGDGGIHIPVDPNFTP